MNTDNRNPLFFVFDNFSYQQNFIKDLQFFTKKRFNNYSIQTFENNITYTSLVQNPTENLDEHFKFLSGVYTNFNGNKDKYILYFSWSTYESFKRTFNFLKSKYYNPKLESFYSEFYRRLKY